LPNIPYTSPDFSCFRSIPLWSRADHVNRGDLSSDEILCGSRALRMAGRLAARSAIKKFDAPGQFLIIAWDDGINENCWRGASVFYGVLGRQMTRRKKACEGQRNYGNPLDWQVSPSQLRPGHAARLARPAKPGKSPNFALSRTD